MATFSPSWRNSKMGELCPWACGAYVGDPPEDHGIHCPYHAQALALALAKVSALKAKLSKTHKLVNEAYTDQLDYKDIKPKLEAILTFLSEEQS
jgi:hypothetical protein